MKQEELQEILKQHKEWVCSNGVQGLRANLEEANLRGADLRGAYLRGANLEEANLEGVNLRGANLEGVNLRGANLEGVNLRGANLRGANLEEANLEGAYLRGANLEEANLEGADLEGAFVYYLVGTTITTFQHNKHFAYFWNGLVTIGCKTLPLKKWLEKYKEIGENEKYTDKEIVVYGAWLHMLDNLVNSGDL